MGITEMGEEKKESKSLNIGNNHQEPEEPMRRRETYLKYPKMVQFRSEKNHRLNYERAMFPPCTPVHT